jgi:hypothetical protein
MNHGVIFEGKTDLVQCSVIRNYHWVTIKPKKDWKVENFASLSQSVKHEEWMKKKIGARQKTGRPLFDHLKNLTSR